MAAVLIMKGSVRETRMTANGELIVEVDTEEDLVSLTSLSSLAGVPVVSRIVGLRVITKGSVFGVHRSTSDEMIVASLKRVGVVAAARVKARDTRLGVMIKTD